MTMFGMYARHLTLFTWVGFREGCCREEWETSDATLISGSDLRIFLQISFADFLVKIGGFLMLDPAHVVSVGFFNC
jgi:hypothetical protein